MDKIFYSIRDMAEQLAVSEKTIYRMVNNNQIPFAVKIGGQWRFRHDAIDTWLANRDSNASKPDNTTQDRGINLHQAINQGAVLYRIHGKNRDECISELLKALPYSSTLDHRSLKVSIFAKESLASSSMQGIANMGISDAQPVFAEKSMVILAFLEKTVDFKAIDKIPTTAFFLTLPANRGEQALLETRLSRLLQESSFREAVNKQPARHEILELIKDFESKIF